MNKPSCDVYRSKYCGVVLPTWYPFMQYVFPEDSSPGANFTFKFPLLASYYLAVYITEPGVDPDEVIDKLALGTDYALDAYGRRGGRLHLCRGYPKGSVITITYSSDFALLTRFKEGVNFDGNELDLIFFQIQQYFREFEVYRRTSIRYNVNTNLNTLGGALVPHLKDGYVWIGKGGLTTQTLLPDGSGGGGCGDEVKKLIADLANNDRGVDGAGMIGIFDEIAGIHTTVRERINAFSYVLNNINPVPAVTINDAYLPLTNDGTNVFWDKRVIGRVYQSAYKKYMPGLLYCDGSGYYPFESSKEGIPYSRLANEIWSESIGNYYFGGKYDSYDCVLPYDKHMFIMINDLSIDNVLYFENMEITTHQKQNKASTTACNSIYEGNRMYIFERAASTGRFIDNNKTGVNFEYLSYNENVKGNSGVLDFNAAALHFNGGEYFTVFGLRVYYIVNGRGAVPPSTGVRRMVRVDLFENHTLGEVEFLTKHAIRGTGLYIIEPNFRENAMFQLRPDLTVYLKRGTLPPGYERDKITVYVPEGATEAQENVIVRNGINKFSFSVPDYRDLVLRGGDANDLSMQTAWKNIEQRKMMRLQYGGNVVSDVVKAHHHEYQITTRERTPYVIASYAGGTVRSYNQPGSNTSKFGGLENRMASAEVYFYIQS